MKSVRHAIIPLIFVLVGFLVYSNILYGPFILDDEGYITDNYQIRDLSNFIDFSGTRYVGFLSFALNYYFGGLNTFGYHIVNVLIHIINAFLVYLLIRITVNNLKSNVHNLSLIAYVDYLPFISSLIFLIHPIQTQAVSYITQRFTSLATLFYLLAIVLYIKTRIRTRVIGDELQDKTSYIHLPLYGLSLVFTVLAMKTKEISFTLPFVIALYEFTFFSRNGLKTKTRGFYLFPFFLTLCIIPIMLLWPKHADTILTAGETIRELQLGDIKDIPVYNYFITQFRVIVTYIRLLILPVNQIFEYDYPLSKSLFEPATFISGLFLLSTLVWTIYLYAQSLKKDNGVKKLISFGILWFFITLSVESSVIPIKDVIFEHRLYLPSVGFILSAATALFYGFGYLEKRINRPLWDYLLAVVVIAAVILSFSTYRRNVLWGDKYLMYLDNVNKAPNRAVPHNNLGILYAKQNRIDEAIKEFLIVLRLKPDHADIHYNLGLAYKTKGFKNEARKEFEMVLKLNPYDADARQAIEWLEK